MDPVSQPVSQKKPLSSAIETALAGFVAFNDFVELRFRFLFDPRCCVGSSDAVESDGIVSLSTEKTFDVDLKKLASLVPDLRLCAEVSFQPDGSVITDELKTPLESIESHLGSMAIKIYPRGNSRLGLDPYVSAKINPSKITYGFNGYSNIHTLGQALPIAMSAFVRGCPDLAARVDVAGCVVMRVDSTSGVHCSTVADVSALLKRISHVQIGHVHAAGSTGTYAEREQKILAKSGDTTYINPNSEHQRGAAYPKGPEAREEEKRLTQELRRDPGNAALAARVEALSDPDYQAYCEKLLRLEARTLRRGLVGQLERLGITDWDGTAVDLIRCERQLADAGTSFVHSLWAHVWRPVLTALWGDPSMSLANETELERKITTYYEENAVGRARSMGTRRALTHLRCIIDRGWTAAKRSPPASQATWYRRSASSSMRGSRWLPSSPVTGPLRAASRQVSWSLSGRCSRCRQSAPRLAGSNRPICPAGWTIRISCPYRTVTAAPWATVWSTASAPTMASVVRSISALIPMPKFLHSSTARPVTV
ncbi:phage/plasmid replication protein, II/X family [Aeromonas veronii]